MSDALFDIDEVAPAVLGDDDPSTPPLVLPDGRVRLSFSSIRAFEQCPRRFRHEWVDRLPTRPSPHASYGTSVHAALATHHARRLPIEPTVEELLRALYASWDRSGFAGLDRAAELAWYRDAQDVLRAWFDRQPRPFRPAVAVEQRFAVPVDDVAVLVGAIDRVDADDDGTLHVVDYKTGRLVDREAVRGSLQLALYAIACEHLWGRLPADVALDHVRAGVVVRVPLDELDLDAARRAVHATAAGVLAEVDTPVPGPGCRWCDFRRVCPAWEGDGPEVLGPAVEEARRLRRSVAADLARLRHLEQGVARLRAALE